MGGGNTYCEYAIELCGLTGQALGLEPTPAPL